MTPEFDEALLVQQYTPLLVLYPEIPPGSTRQTNPDYPHAAPLNFDYHPRDIRLVLEHSSLPIGWDWLLGARTCSWEKMLRRMESRHYGGNLNLLANTKSNDREGFWSAYAGIPKDNPAYQRRCYARLAKGVDESNVLRDRLLVQYWYPYFYNDFWNTHEMDWEVVMIVFKLTKRGPRPRVCANSAHMGGYWLPWPEVEKAVDTQTLSAGGTHPVVYVANGSHANYFFGPGLYLTAPPLAAMAAKLLKKNRRLVDYTESWDGGERHLVPAQPIPASQHSLWTGKWRWLNLRGRWGSPGEFLELEFGNAAPLGPPQSGDRWDFPFRWIDTCCTRAPSSQESRLPSLWDAQELETFW